jgi:hypothetical protein
VTWDRSCDLSFCSHRLVGLVLVESAPQLLGQVERPFARTMSVSLRHSVNLGVSLEHLMSGRPFSLYECFVELLSHSDKHDDEEILTFKNLLFFSDEPCYHYIKYEVKVHFSTWPLCACQRRLNLMFPKDAFSHRRYAALARPGMKTFLPMIHLRRLIVGLRDCLSEAREDCLNIELCSQKSIRPEYAPLRPPTLGKTLTEVSEDLSKLDGELNDEIHLIIGAVTVQDSDANKQQSEWATLLTLLAAVYLPLTLVTGIFDMNIKDINDGNPSWRACGIVLAVVAAGTIISVLACREWRRWRRGRQERKRMELGFRKDV